MRFYAHVGPTGPFQTYNGRPYNTFMAFDSKKERQDYQDKVWEESNHQRNVVFCSRKYVESWFGRNFYVGHDKLVYRSEDIYVGKNLYYVYPHLNPND